VAGVRRLAESPAVRGLVEPVLGDAARLVRSILFTKGEDANWQVPWHQDLAIAVRERAEVAGYASWSVKDGVPHVQPPIAVLEQMLAVRLHLDAADASNGALWVSPGSHRLGRLAASEAAGAAERLGAQVCAVAAGDALVLRPLLLHASRKVTSARPRRVVHLEFCAAELPAPLAWAEEASR
jgi:ectoine hydroxylase-related dioxygenase (phytanoyl-CoA dioxygenase family)